MAIATLGFAYGLMQTALAPVTGWLFDHVGFAPVSWMVALGPVFAWLVLRQNLTAGKAQPALVEDF